MNTAKTIASKTANPVGPTTVGTLEIPKSVPIGKLVGLEVKEEKDNLCTLAVRAWDIESDADAVDFFAAVLNKPVIRCVEYMIRFVTDADLQRLKTTVSHLNCISQLVRSRIKCDYCRQMCPNLLHYHIQTRGTEHRERRFGLGNAYQSAIVKDPSPRLPRARVYRLTAKEVGIAFQQVS